MLEMIITLNEIDYSSIAEKAIPVLLNKMGEDGKNARLVSVLSKFRGLPQGMMKVMLKTLNQDMKDEITVHLLNMYKKDILEKLNSYMTDHQLAIKFTSLLVEKHEHIEIKVIIDQIDYPAVIQKAYPVVMEKLRENEKYGKILQLASALNNYTDKLILAALEALSQEEKDNLVIGILEAYQQDIVKYLGSWMQEKEIRADVVGITIRKALIELVEIQ